MLLKSLEIHGFKSFPDKTVLRFGEGITAVVGPNGSGKSNISDAVRWVLGEQSTKSLRGSKMQDVVFGGTQARRALGFAEVTLTIENSDRVLNIDSDDVSITRRYYRSGESEYMINGATVRLRDIHETFMDTGLGRDGYSIIGQGRISDIVSSRSEDRREIFEEAAGISKYRYRKNEAERNLAKAEDNLSRLRDILSELESRIGPLAQQSEKAQKFLTYAAEKKELEIGLWLFRLDSLKNSIREQEHKITVASAQYEDAEKQLALVEKQIEEIIEKSQQLTAEIESIRLSAANLEEEAAKTDGEAAVLKNTVYHNNSMIEKLRDDIKSIEGGGKSLEEEIAAKTEYIAAKKSEAADILKKCDEARAQADEIRRAGSDSESEINKLRQTAAELSVQAANARVAAVTAQTAIGETQMRGGAVDESIAEKRAAAEELSAEFEAILKDVADNTELTDSLQNTIKGYEYRVATRSQKLEEQQKKADDLRRRAGDAQSRAAMLADLEKNLEGFAYSVKQIMKEAGRGTLSGIHGPVSRLIKTQDKYSTAIELALGAAMQNIVVGTEQDAKRAIRWLKQSNGGRATFLPITSIKGRTLNESGLDSCEGFVGLAVDIVTYDAQYAGIVSSLLGRIAVAEDLDYAVAIAKKYSYRFKVVTLDGQVVNAGGSLTGGSAAKSAGLLSRTAEIEKLRRQADEISEQAAQQEQQLVKLQQELSLARAELSGAQGELKTAQEDRIRLAGEHRRLSDALEDNKNTVAALEAEKKGSSEKLAALKAEFDKNTAAYDSLNSEINALEQQISEKEGEHQRQGESHTRLLDVLSELQLSLLAANKDVESAELAVEELRTRAGDSDKRIKQINEEIDSILHQNDEIDKNIEALTVRAAELRESSQKSKGDIERLTGERTAAEKDSSSLRVLEREKSAEREKISGELARLTERRATMLTDYDDVIKRLYDEYQLTRREAEEQGITVDEPAKAQGRLNEIKSKIRALGSVNVAAIDEYKEVSERYEFMSAQVSDVEKSRDELYRLINDLTSNMKELFEDRFVKINKNFAEIFAELFGGGKAALQLSDPSNVLESGIDMLIQPPGKNVQNIDLFSGGEKSLTAIALYFAILRVSPAPFCILDEIEAALDDVNVDRFANYLRRMCGRTQFIAITHRRGTMEEADMLYGVTMQEEGVSKLLELNVSEVSSRLGI